MYTKTCVFIISKAHYYTVPTPNLSLDMRLNIVSRNALLLLTSVSTVMANVVGVGQHIEDILLLIRLALMEPEEDATNKRQASNGRVVPDEQGVFRQRHESLANGVGKGRHEVEVGSNERTHVLGRFGKGKLETSDGREDLGETYEHVRNGLYPDVDGRWGVAAVHVVAACARLVDVVLDDGRGNHGEGGEDETEGHALDGCEADVCFAEGWVQEVVDNRDEDDKRDWVQVGDDVVGDTVTCHGSSLRGEVVVHLVV
jgi:hypothetical protein